MLKRVTCANLPEHNGHPLPALFNVLLALSVTFVLSRLPGYSILSFKTCFVSTFGFDSDVVASRGSVSR